MYEKVLTPSNLADAKFFEQLVEKYIKILLFIVKNDCSAGSCIVLLYDIIYIEIIKVYYALLIILSDGLHLIVSSDIL